MMVKNTSISINLEKNVASIPNQTLNTIGLLDDSGNIKENIKHVELDDVCICKKVPFSSDNIPISLSKFNLITRIVASSLLRSISIQHSESDEIGEDYISFSINKLLTSTNEVLNILTVIPVSHYIFLNT
ncbi:hypothetical protein FG379_002054 [Cryptosporidium bovis]|uniref:uncharacterized protein n=1 Tax=Cryptosporidium bovis TaxID=310047 RepID=UPI003519EE8C|nr:hypothetical protein FG379_002054 [Cryptosporidium bovis]